MRKKIILPICLIIMACGNISNGAFWLSEGHYIWTESDPYYDEVFVENDAILDFTGGVVGKLEAINTASINITGGSLDQLWAGDQTIVDIFECFDLAVLEARHSSIINLYTDDFFYSPTGGEMNQGYIDGLYYGADTAFNISFYDETSYSHVSIVPEPATILLTIVGAVFLRRKSRLY